MEGIKLKTKFSKVIDFQSWAKFTGAPFLAFEIFSYMETSELSMPLKLT